MFLIYNLFLTNKMIDKLISYLMNKYLNEFIENIDPKELGASLLKGSLELKNM